MNKNEVVNIFLKIKITKPSLKTLKVEKKEYHEVTQNKKTSNFGFFKQILS